MKAYYRARLLAAACLLAGCVHGPAMFGHNRSASFDDMLVQARALADAGRFQESDRTLELYAIQHPTESESVESLYWRAVLNLDAANAAGSLDTAIAQLDEYLASPSRLAHLSEAAALRSLARDAQQLARVQMALRQARADARAGADQAGETRSSDEVTKEVQRLRDELAAANAELERIRKRLANPKP